MDSPTSNLQRWKKRASDRRFKAFVIAVLVLIVIVALQIGNLKNHTPMSELFGTCNLRNIDLHRIQIALSKSGLAEFEVKDHQILVPKIKHAQYLQAIAEQNAIPPELRGGDSSSAIANPFLSRSQQLSIERETRKQHIQEMVIRLPFVDTAWFEMDDSTTGNAFQPVEKSAVISIRPVEYQPLLDQHVDTVRQMIKGAVTGIAPDQIVVIDLSTGFAYRDASLKTPTDRQLDAQRIAYSRQQMLSERLRESLIPFPGVTASVVVEPVDETEDQVAVSSSKPLVAPQMTEPPKTAREILSLSNASAGANGQASIYDASNKSMPLIEIAPVVHFAPIDVEPRNIVTRERVTVVIDVPYELLVKRFGVPNGSLAEKPLSFTTRSTGDETSYRENRTELTEQNFAKLKTEIEAVVRPLINRGATDEVPIAFNLIQPATLPVNPWVENIRAFAIENWPSLAVLLIGLMLLSLVTQQGRLNPMVTESAAPESVADIVSFKSKSSTHFADEHVEVDEKKIAAELRLSQLIEQDPDAAARVIESWIRDAA